MTLTALLAGGADAREVSLGSTEWPTQFNDARPTGDDLHPYETRGAATFLPLIVEHRQHMRNGWLEPIQPFVLFWDLWPQHDVGSLCEDSAVRPSDFFIEEPQKADPIFGVLGSSAKRVNEDLLDELLRGPLTDKSDAEAAVALARLVHDVLQAFGTGGGQLMDADQIRLAIQALRAATRRLGIDGFKVPFRDFSSFRDWWINNGAGGSYQARRDLLAEIFNDLHDQLADMEQEELEASLVNPISPHSRTGWSVVDTEISELRRHFNTARTPQDYRAVGLGCVAVTEVLSAQVYDPKRHLREGEEEPPVAKTKQRIERFIEDTAPGADNQRLRTLARAVIEYAQEVKHSTTPTRREAGIAADAVIQLANILRRLGEPE